MVWRWTLTSFPDLKRLKVKLLNPTLQWLLCLSFRTARVGVSQRSGCDMVSSQRGVRGRQRHQLSTDRRHQNRQVRHRPPRRPQHLRLHAVHLPNRLHSGELTRISRAMLFLTHLVLLFLASPPLFKPTFSCCLRGISKGLMENLKLGPLCWLED